VEYSDRRPETADVEITTDRRVWLSMIFRQSNFASATEQGLVTVSGDRAKLDAFLEAYKGAL